VKKMIVILLHAFVGWALCGAIMGIGMAVTSIETTLIIHAKGAQLFLRFYLLSIFENSITPLHYKPRLYSSDLSFLWMFVL
jgi:hypothetical protein